MVSPYAFLLNFPVESQIGVGYQHKKVIRQRTVNSSHVGQQQHQVVDMSVAPSNDGRKDGSEGTGKRKRRKKDSKTKSKKRKKEKTPEKDKKVKNKIVTAVTVYMPIILSDISGWTGASYLFMPFLVDYVLRVCSRSWS